MFAAAGNCMTSYTLGSKDEVSIYFGRILPHRQAVGRRAIADQYGMWGRGLSERMVLKFRVFLRSAASMLQIPEYHDIRKLFLLTPSIEMY